MPNPPHVYPGAMWRPLPEDQTQPIIAPTQLIFHTGVDGRLTTTLYNYWNSSGINLESHGYVQQGGGFEQYMRCNRRADANAKANPRAISVETWDGWASTGQPGEVAIPWNDAQLVSLLLFADWACTTYGIPRRLAPAWDAPGIGPHRLYPEWAVSGTACPGTPRFRQVTDIIIPLLNWTPPPIPTEPPPRGSTHMLDTVTLPETHEVAELRGRAVEVRAFLGAIAISVQEPNGGQMGPFEWLPVPALPFEVDSVNLRCANNGQLEVRAWHTEHPEHGVVKGWQSTPGGTWEAWLGV